MASVIPLAVLNMSEFGIVLSGNEVVATTRVSQPVLDRGCGTLSFSNSDCVRVVDDSSSMVADKNFL